MALNPSYDVIGKGFVQQYYLLFDDPAQRQNLISMYNVSFSFVSHAKKCEIIKDIIGQKTSPGLTSLSSFLGYFTGGNVVHDVRGITNPGCR